MKRMLLTLALGFLALLQGCDNQSGKTTVAPPQKKIRLAFIANNEGPYWSIVRLGCDTAKRPGGNLDANLDLVFRSPHDRTAAGQQEIMTELIAQGVDGIAISPIDAEKQTEFLSSIPTNILLVCADSDAPKSRRICYIGTDNIAAGTQAADLLKTALPQGGKVVLFVGSADSQNVRERIEGIKQGLAGSNLQIMDIQAADGSSLAALKNAQEALAKYPDLAGMVALNNFVGPAVLQATRGAGKAGQVKIVCFDEDNDILAGIAAGDIYGSIVQSPFKIGVRTVSEMASHLRGETNQLATGKLFTPSQVVTKDNLASFQMRFKATLAASQEGTKE
jgi:ribose transport system substrate-binding protein